MTNATKHCAPLPGGTPSLDEAQIRTLLAGSILAAKVDHAVVV